MVSLKFSPWPKYTKFRTIFPKKIVFHPELFCLLQMFFISPYYKIPDKKIGGNRACLRVNVNLFRYRAYLEGNLLCFGGCTCSCALTNDAKIVHG